MSTVRTKTQIEVMADDFAGSTSLDRSAIALMRTWGEKASERDSVAAHPTAYIATFADMARTVAARSCFIIQVAHDGQDLTVGPFATEDEAQDWLDVREIGTGSILPLSNPDQTLPVRAWVDPFEHE